MMQFLYQKILKPFLFKFHPDQVHNVFVYIGILTGKFKPLRWLIRAFYGRPIKPNAPLIVDGISYQGPVLLAAGFDYNAYLSPILYELGFAGEEIGSVTAKPCPGNPPPNTTRLIKSQSIQVYKGLKNDGVDAIINRIKQLSIPNEFVMGISIARTNIAENADLSQGIEDYVYSYRRLNQEGIGRFYTINISCPNSFTGEDFATAENLRNLVQALKTVPSTKPMYIKMPINKEWPQFKELLDVIVQEQVHGVVIGNLNKNYAEVDFTDELPNGGEVRGGLSGKPCRKRSNQLIKLTREYCPNLTIMGCGGILSAEDAMEKIILGANLVQLITGMIFNGPHLMNQINDAYTKAKII